MSISQAAVVALTTALPCTLASTATGQAPTQFTAPDGSRFLLIPSAGPPVVHWAIASPCGPAVDPAAAPGLAAACALASLNGTWQVGSLEATREAAALSALDQAEAELAAAPRVDGEPPAALVQKVAELKKAADHAADPLAFRRVLLGAPATDVQVDIDGNAAVLQLTTTPAGVATVARLLVERREGQSLRSARAVYEQRRLEATAAWDADPLAPLRAEALALAFPTSALARVADRPPTGGFTRPLAQTIWARTQHPSQVQHVLTGNFDPALVAQTLRSTFASTALPAPAADTPVTPRQAAAVRRSVVPGARHPAAVIGWLLPGGEAQAELACMARWFADGDTSWLAQQLQRGGRAKVEVRCDAPWPGPPGQGMLLVQVTDLGDGPPALADEILRLCKAAMQKQPRQGELAAAHAQWLAEWQEATAGGLAAAHHLAVELLLLPAGSVRPAPPTELDYAQLPARLQRLLDSNPVVVEWRSL